MNTTTLPITFDKSHLVTLGEKLYQEGVELIRELVCNAYDADATNVWIDITPYTIKVRDDGSGMDLSGLKQYLTIGSEEKKHNTLTQVYKRTRIGQFGIGKFAVLSAAAVFKVTTQKGDYRCQLEFDETLWKQLENWDVPLHTLPVDHQRGNGTTITLERLKKSFTLPQLEKAIRERTPLKAPHFRVFLNDRQIEPYKIPGKSFAVAESTEFGPIIGEITIPHFTQKIETPGIEVTVKGILVQRMTFGLEHLHNASANRIVGSVEAAFLPVTTDRTRFLTDSDLYLVFMETMQKVMKRMLRAVKDTQRAELDLKADKALLSALRSIRKALRKNAEFSPLTMTPGKEKDFSSIAGNTTDPSTSATNLPPDLPQTNPDHQGLKPLNQPTTIEPKIKRIKMTNKQGEEVVARKIKVGQLGVVCTFEELGVDAPEYLNESGAIIINRSHQMYHRAEKKEELMEEYILRLISQELARQYHASNSTKAFDLMNQLLRDAVL